MTVSFTANYFSSQWLEKVAEMQKSKIDAKSKENFEDMNPLWLKDKGK